jgi:hypothetical protein
LKKNENNELSKAAMSSVAEQIFLISSHFW